MAKSRWEDCRDEDLKHENVISLKHFPYKLRKIGKIMLQSESKMTLKEACEAAGVNYGSIRSTISREKKKGNDFYKLLEEEADQYLKIHLLAVDAATVQGALEDSARDRELFYKRVGKLKESIQVEINNNLSLTYAVKVDTSVSDSNKRSKGQNELIPYIPNTK